MLQPICTPIVNIYTLSHTVTACTAGSPLSVADQAIAGVGAGFTGSLIACPTELIKCRLQAQANTKPKSFPAAPSVGLATLSQSQKSLAHLVKAGAQPQGVPQVLLPNANMQGVAAQHRAMARQRAAVGLASLSQSGKGLAGLVQAGARPQCFSTATSGTTPGALHLGEITVSALSLASLVYMSICLPAYLSVWLTIHHLLMLLATVVTCE